MKRQLTAMLSDRLGMDHDLAARAAELALEFVKEKLPDSVAPYFSAASGGGVGEIAGGVVGDALGALGVGGLQGLGGKGPKVPKDEV